MDPENKIMDPNGGAVIYSELTELRGNVGRVFAITITNFGGIGAEYS